MSVCFSNFVLALPRARISANNLGAILIVVRDCQVHFSDPEKNYYYYYYYYYYDYYYYYYYYNDQSVDPEQRVY